MTDDKLFEEYLDELQRRALADYGVWIEPGVVHHTVEGAGKVVRFDAGRARCHGGVRVQVYEAVARLCNGMVTHLGPAGREVKGNR
jgi:hypothetical protein